MPDTANSMRPRLYNALLRRGLSAQRAAQIANRTPATAQKADGEKVEIVGNLCRVGGQFAPCDAGAESGGGGSETATPAAAEPPPPPDPAAGPPVGTDATTDFLKGLGLDPKLSESLGEYLAGAADGEDVALNREAAAALEALGLVNIRPGQEGSSNVTIDLSGLGGKLADAVGKGDIAKAMTQVERAHTGFNKREAKRQEVQKRREARAAARESARAARRQARQSPGGSTSRSGGRSIAPPQPNAGPTFRAVHKAMRPKRKRLWQRAYAQAKAAGMAPADARKRARAALRHADERKAFQAHQRALGRMAEKSFTVFKDASGADRWLLRTTTAFQDRDGEILSVAALDADSRRMTEAGRYGPLRYWHCGQPDDQPGMSETPWGPGLDLGMCDTSVVIGRTRYESGTFYRPEVAAAFKAAADEYESSPGFYHTHGDDGPLDGVYEYIDTFERSLVPIAHARASNFFTGLTVKEQRMNTTDMERRVKAFIADMERKGVDASSTLQLLEQGSRAEKAADTRQIAYKEAAQPTYVAPDGTLFIVRDGQAISLKAMAPEQKADMPGGEMVEAGATEVEDGEDREMEDGEEPLLTTVDIEAVAARVVALLMENLGGLQSAMGAMEETAKQYGFARMKEASDTLAARLKSTEAQIAALSQTLERYVADLPAQVSTQPGSLTGADDPIVRQAAAAVGIKEAGAEVGESWIANIPWPFDVPDPRAVAPHLLNVQPEQHQAPGIDPARS